MMSKIAIISFAVLTPVWAGDGDGDADGDGKGDGDGGYRPGDHKGGGRWMSRGDGDGDGDGAPQGCNGGDAVCGSNDPSTFTPCINPTMCNCPCGWKQRRTTNVCRLTPGALCQNSLSDDGSRVAGPHMETAATIEDCMAGCEKTPKCIAIDYAERGDRKCWYYSECPNPGPAFSQAQNPGAYIMLRTVCADTGCSATNAPATAGWAQAMMQWASGGNTICSGATITGVTLVSENVYELTMSGSDCTTINSAVCKDAIKDLARDKDQLTTHANVMEHQIDIGVSTCTSERRAKKLSTPSSTITVTFTSPNSISGDPFVSYNGKQTQFYLPVGKVTKLMKCGGVTLWGRTFTSKVENDPQQWFDQYKVAFASSGDGIKKIVVSTRDITLGTKDVADSKADIELVGEQHKSRVQDLLKAALERTRDAKEKAKQRQTLTTMNVVCQSTDEGEVVKEMKMVNPGMVPTWEDDKLNMTASVTQNLNKIIGTGYGETLDIHMPAMALQIKTSVAEKFDKKEDKLKFLHLDLQFPKLDASSCVGLLPELWGIRPMTMAHSAYLTPPQNTAKEEQ